ncbi:DUF4328 domain-containing protein [Jatrophihabitans sp. GAS493]|uniref:DUF4328 domain-containing protein n=1 Tax=Jatrophihabitans sp. GAS493 TaxID=1907575 RepID=UPI0012FDC8D7|nr:DUF4328 domain-containing protein [Jatrophihabitans sp. GAS493]
MTFSDPNPSEYGTAQYQPPPVQYQPVQYQPVQYQPVQYPSQPYPPQHQSAYPPAYPAAYPAGYGGLIEPSPRRSVAGLAIALRVLLIAMTVISAAGVLAWLNELRLLSAVRSDPGSVDLETARTADDLVTLTNGVRILLLIATGVVTIVWLHRARVNAGSYGGHRQRYSPGWSIGGWFIPVASLWIPYAIVVDAQLASEPTQPPAGARGGRSVLVIRAWWGMWVLGNLATLAGRGGDSNDLDSLTTHARLALAGATGWLVAGLLMMPVVSRLSAVQTRRNVQLIGGRTDRHL